MLARTSQERNNQNPKKKDSNKKEENIFEFCKGIGHIRDTCFKIHGYPDWFKQLKKEKGNASKAQVNLTSSSFDDGQVVEKKGNSAQLSLILSDLVQKEVIKFLKNEHSGEQVNFAHISDFAEFI